MTGAGKDTAGAKNPLGLFWQCPALGTEQSLTGAGELETIPQGSAHPFSPCTVIAQSLPSAGCTQRSQPASCLPHRQKAGDF